MTNTDEFLAAAVERLDRIERLLGERLPPRPADPEPPAAGTQPIDIKEPAPPRKAAGTKPRKETR